MNLQLDQRWTFEDVDFLLQQVPNVTQLKLTCHYLLIDGNKWEMLLTENCSRLRIFELIFSNGYFDTLELFTELQSRFSTRFWLEHNVQFEHNKRVHDLIVRFKT